MVTSFEAPAELIEFTWEAAKAAAQVFSGVPQITPLHVLGPPCKWRIASARRLFFHLVRQHVWTPCVPNGTQGRLPIAIVFGDVEPFPGRPRCRPARMSYRMIGWLTGRAHTTAGIKRRINLSEQQIQAAESFLA
ncbi:MAG: hypothetical protein GX616_16440, partial [Planctomycetes bacterium]|nr:hypothetical protein [Planctomycetota bacterium]